MLQLRYGSYVFEAGAITFDIQTIPVWNEGGQWIAQRKIADWKGYLYGNGQSDLTQKISALQTAMSVPGQDLVLLQSDGSTTAHLLTNAGSITGVMIKRGPVFPQNTGGEYSTYRYFEFTAEAEYPFVNAAASLRNFTETVTFGGGGPFFFHRRALRGLPQKQRLCEHTEYTAVQEGEAVGYLTAPRVPGPIWPMALKEAPSITRMSPKRRGNGFGDYSVRWRYTFESSTPLVGSPNLWLV